jgi:predicted nuclease of predicted toxin-antitoxin system
MARLYADENFPQPVVMELRRLGHEVLTTQEAGKAGQKVPDETVLADACADSRAVLTHNRKDFIRLHSAQPNHAGIIVCTADLDFEGLASRIDTAIRSQPQLSGQLIRVNRPGSPQADC